ncbi:MAG: bifunctional nuclease family protein [Treponema sp.]|jgi:bifunctional DNase/RNase|nr:bifunctional nuclease family protein [Treponema sp.]
MREMLSAEIWSIGQNNQGNAVLLRPRDLGIAVPIFIGQLEMQSILIGREGISLPRPLTHDLFLNMLHHLGLSLERVEVHELKDNTFHARLIISGGRFSEEEPLIMDSRPSDAFALAVRRRCPILIASTVVEQAGIPLDCFLDELEETERNIPAGPEVGESPSPEEFSHEMGNYRKLLDQLNQAVAAEEYERAAKIRDMLNLLDKGQEGREI